MSHGGGLLVKFYAFLIVGGLITSLLFDMWLHWLGYGLAFHVMQRIGGKGPQN